MTRRLAIGNKTYSSWSLRPWLGMKVAGLAFEEHMIGLRLPDTAARIAEVSDTGRISVLHDDGLVVHESLAILEYAAELAPAAQLWPEDMRARAVARAVATEMHCGFSALRNWCPMDLRRVNQARATALPDDVALNCKRIVAVWNQCRARYATKGPFLFGHFTIADAMFAPVVTRFHSYALPRNDVAEAYMAAVLALPAFQEWTNAAMLEDEILGGYAVD